MSEFPYKVKHKNGSVGVATGVHKIKDGYYYKVKRINGTKSQSNWSLGMAEPCDPNEVGNRVDSRTYVGDKSSSQVWNKGRKQKQKTGSGRICRMCNKEITNGNWWYCADCNRKRLLSIAHHERMEGWV